MAEQHKETKTAKNFEELVAKSIPRDVGYINFLSPSERDRVVSRDILREIDEPYFPIDDAHIRVIDIQRSISRGPHWDRMIFENLKELNNKVSNLQEKVEEISETLQDTVRIYNATIYELNNLKYMITTPIQIVIIEDEDEIVARMPELNLYATGDTDSEAIYELKQELIELYEDLNSTDNKLGPLPESWLNTINELIVRTDG